MRRKGFDSAAVIGVPHKRLREPIHAVVAIRRGKRDAGAELIAHYRERIAGFKVPRFVEIQAEPRREFGGEHGDNP